MSTKITNEELESKLISLIRDERRLTNEILTLISIADTRRLYLDRGYPSLFEWLTKHFGYSESAAQRRIQAARLMKAVPQIKEKIEKGEVTLTNASKVQSAIRQQEKISGVKLTNYEKTQVVEKIENKSSLEAEKALIKIFPKTASHIKQERKMVIDETTTRLALNVSADTLKELERARDLLSHSFPEGNLSQVIGYIVRDYLQRKDPLRKKTASRKNKSVYSQPESQVQSRPQRFPQTVSDRQSLGPESTAAAAKQCVSRPARAISASVRRNVIKSSGGRCTYRDSRTGIVCGSSFQLQIDHIWPVALGGTDEIANLRCLCRNHNLAAASEVLGSVF